MGAGDVLVKKMTIANGSIAATAGSLVAVTNFSSSLVESAPATEWASFAARYQQYRVKKMRLILTPWDNVSQNGIVNEMTMYSADFIGSTVPGSAAQVLADESSSIFTSFSKHVKSASSKRNLNADLWNPTNAAIPVANQYGIAIASSTTGGAVAAGTVFTYTIEFIVEFRGSQ